MIISVSYRFENEDNLRTISFEARDEKVYKFSNAVKRAKDQIERLHSIWELEQIVEFNLKIEY